MGGRPVSTLVDDEFEPDPWTDDEIDDAADRYVERAGGWT